MEHKELIDYLAIAQPADLHQLAFEYAVVERWDLLALVVIELRRRIDVDNAITKSYAEKHCGDRNDAKGISDVPEGSKKTKAKSGGRGSRDPVTGGDNLRS